MLVAIFAAVGLGVLTKDFGSRAAKVVMAPGVLPPLVSSRPPQYMRGAGSRLEGPGSRAPPVLRGVVCGQPQTPDNRTDSARDRAVTGARTVGVAVRHRRGRG